MLRNPASAEHYKWCGLSVAGARGKSEKVSHLMTSSYSANRDTTF